MRTNRIMKPSVGDDYNVFLDHPLVPHPEESDCASQGCKPTVASAFAESLRQLATWVEAHDEIVTSGYDCYAHVSISEFDLADFQRNAAKFGASEKFDEYGTIGLRRTFGSDYVKAELRIPKTSSCERREVGTKTVTKMVNADEVPEGATVIVPTRVTIEVEEPEYEWDCPGSFLANS